MQLRADSCTMHQHPRTVQHIDATLCRYLHNASTSYNCATDWCNSVQIVAPCINPHQHPLNASITPKLFILANSCTMLPFCATVSCNSFVHINAWVAHHINQSWPWFCNWLMHVPGPLSLQIFASIASKSVTLWEEQNIIQCKIFERQIWSLRKCPCFHTP